jgi:uroporphyrinogen decarboxylase
MNARENWLRAIEYRRPEWIPCWVQLAPIAWKHHGHALEDLVARHPRLFPDFKPGDIKDFNAMPTGFRKDEVITDKWGCKRLCLEDGIAGLAISHPLEDWGALDSYVPPDPLAGSLDEITQGHWAFLHGRDVPLTWAEAEVDFKARRARGELVMGDGEKLLDRLYFLRGFENLMIDFATEPPELDRLIQMLLDYEQRLTRRWLQIGVDAISYHTDFSTQTGLMMSPRSFRKYLVPLFTAIFQDCRRAGVHVVLSSDGVTTEVADDMKKSGVTMHDPQLRANTVQGIARAFKGKMCVVVDLDQQGFPFMKPREIYEQVRDVRDAITLPEGGLMIKGVINDTSTPLANIEALITAMEELCWS